MSIEGFKGTPGEWRTGNDCKKAEYWNLEFDPPRGGGGSSAMTIHNGKEFVAMVGVDDPWGKDDVLGANARLIASSPKLLKALQELVFEVTQADGHTHYTDKARAAIAEALGVTNDPE